MKKLTYLIIYIVVLMACTSQGRYTAMRKGLDSINMLNKSYQPFTVADIQPYVQYFDDYGTSNDRVLAYYLMGRAYHDQREAPMALEYYQKAIEQADTTEKDFDFAQLSKVYGQMADLFYYQNLYDEQLVSLEKAIFNAWKSKDTLAAIMDKYVTDDPDPAEIDMNRGAKGGKLWVGCAASFPPYEMRMAMGFAGIDIELCAAIAKKLDRELVIADYRFDTLAEALESGRVDMICSALAVTEERARTMDFTKPYDANQEVVLVLADGK